MTILYSYPSSQKNPHYSVELEIYRTKEANTSPKSNMKTLTQYAAIFPNKRY